MFRGKTLSMTVLLVTLLSVSAWSLVTVESASGLIQYRSPAGGEWLDIRSGMEIPEGSVVVSGLDGQALLRMGSAELTVEPLSRVVLTEIDIRSRSEATSLSVPYGRIHAQVRRSQNRGIDFRVLTPISTAAVRGTEFDYDGTTLRVLEGDVAFSNLIGQSHSVREGQRSRTWGHQSIESVEQTMLEEIDF